MHTGNLTKIVFGRDQNNVAFRQLLPLVAYPVLFCILIVPPLIARVYGFASSTPNEGLLILLAICLPAWSFTAGVTLIVHIGALIRTEIMRIVLPMIRARITEDEFFQRDITADKKGARSSTYFSIPSEN